MEKKSSKDRLIEATIEAIFENGLNSVTTAKIAKQAKLSEAMIYKHFINKDKIIIASFMMIKVELNNYVESRITKEMDFELRSYIIWLSHVKYFIDNPKKLRVLNQFEHSNFMNDEIRSECLNLSSFVMNFFFIGIQKKIFKPMHIEIAIALFFSPILSIAESVIDNRIDQTDEMFKSVYNSTIKGLKV